MAMSMSLNNRLTRHKELNDKLLGFEKDVGRHSEFSFAYLKILEEVIIGVPIVAINIL